MGQGLSDQPVQPPPDTRGPDVVASSRDRCGASPGAAPSTPYPARGRAGGRRVAGVPFRDRTRPQGGLLRGARGDLQGPRPAPGGPDGGGARGVGPAGAGDPAVATPPARWCARAARRVGIAAAAPPGRSATGPIVGPAPPGRRRPSRARFVRVRSVRVRPERPPWVGADGGAPVAVGGPVPVGSRLLGVPAKDRPSTVHRQDGAVDEARLV